MKSYKRILVPTDFSKPSETAAARALNLVKCFDAELTVIHIVDYVPPGYAAAELPRSLASEDALIDRASKYLADWMQNNGLAKSKHIIRTGSPKRRIVEAAKQSGTDLIVMGTHGERGLAKLLGSTTQAVMQDADCDVLAVRAQN